MKAKKTKKAPAPRSIRRLFPNVKYLVDAKTPVSVRVKKTDCTTAVPLDPSECALARAVKREYHADAAVIGLSTSYVIKGDTATRFASGERIAREIVSFDRHSDFEPGTYNLVPKSPTKRLGIRKGGEKKGDNHKYKPKVYHTAKVRNLSNSSGVTEADANE